MSKQTRYPRRVTPHWTWYAKDIEIDWTEIDWENLFRVSRNITDAIEFERQMFNVPERLLRPDSVGTKNEIGYQR